MWENWYWHTIERSTVVDNNFYIGDTAYCKINLYSTYDSSFAYERFDTLDQIFYKYDYTLYFNNYNFPFYKKNFQLSDTLSFFINPGNQYVRYIEHVFDTAYVFDTLVAMKVLHWSAGGLSEGTELWTEEFGRLYSEVNGEVRFQLRGCIIDGKVYGDTTIVGIKTEELKPTEFKLYQNYPNPFNPITNIKYENTSETQVKLSVFDILGQEITVLVDELQYPGIYTVVFKGEGLSSGIYIYKLIIGGKHETK